MTIKFTQYLRPHGRQVAQYIDRPKDIEDKAVAVVVAGGRFEMEELMTGKISITCAYDDEDIAHRICENGPHLPATVDAIVEDAYELLVKRRDPVA